MPVFQLFHPGSIAIIMAIYKGFNMNFAQKIYLIRSKSGLSQDAMANKFEVSRQTISKWESGLSYLEIDKIIKISELFDVSIDYLLKDNYKEQLPNSNLEQAVIQFLGASQDMTKMSETLVDIMRDGIIDENEQIQLENSIQTLDQIIENVKMIRNIIIAKK